MNYNQEDIFVGLTMVLSSYTEDRLRKLYYEMLINMCNRCVTPTDYTPEMLDKLIDKETGYVNTGILSDISWEARTYLEIDKTRVDPAYTGEYPFEDQTRLNIYGEEIQKSILG